MIEGSQASHAVRVIRARAAETAEWAEIAGRCPYATFFHGPIWLGAFAAALPGTTVATRIVEFEDGKDVVLPLLRRTRAGGLFRAFSTTAAGCYGGAISTGPLSAGHLRGLLSWARRTLPNLYWRINPLDPHAGVLEESATERDSSEQLVLTDFADDEMLKAHYRHSARKQVNKGIRAGFEVRVAEAWVDWQAYYGLYEQRLGQWGKTASSRYPVDLFRSFHDARGQGVKLWLIFKDGVLAGGNLNFYHGRHAVEWHAAYDRDYFPLGVRDFLVHTIIEDARARGYEIYDFNPSGGHEGTRRFKQSFGTTSVPASVIQSRNLIGRVLDLRKA